MLRLISCIIKRGDRFYENAISDLAAIHMTGYLTAGCTHLRFHVCTRDSSGKMAADAGHVLSHASCTFSLRTFCSVTFAAYFSPFSNMDDGQDFLFFGAKVIERAGNRFGPLLQALLLEGQPLVVIAMRKCVLSRCFHGRRHKRLDAEVQVNTCNRTRRS